MCVNRLWIIELKEFLIDELIDDFVDVMSARK